MITSYRDPVFGKIYVRKEDKFFNEETGLEIKEGWAIANGFKPESWGHDPPQIFSPKGEMYVLDGKDQNGIPMYKHTKMVPMHHKIGYNKALRQGFKEGITITDPCVHYCDLQKTMKEAELRREKDTKIDTLVSAIDNLIVARANKRYPTDEVSYLRKALKDLL